MRLPIAIGLGFGGLAVVACVAVLLIASRKHGVDSPVSMNGIQNQKAAAQMELANLNVNKSEPLSADFFFYLPTERSARAVETELKRSGFTVEVNEDEGKLPWCCTAHKKTPVDQATIGSLGKKFEALAMAHGGEYDGWGCELN